MNKNELKQARKELVSMMHLMREKQATRRTQIKEKPGEKHNLDIDKMIIRIMANNTDYYLSKSTQSDVEFMDALVSDMKEKKHK